MPKPSQRFVVSSGRVGSEDRFSSEKNRFSSVPSDTTIRNGLLGVGTIFVSTLIAGEWGFAASIVVIVILHGYYDSGKNQRQLDSTVRQNRKYTRR